MYRQVKAMIRKEREIKFIYVLVILLFAVFLGIPIIRLLFQSFFDDGAAGISNYVEVLTGRGFMQALGNSLAVSACSALAATFLAFILAYSIQYTNLNKKFKGLIRTMAVLPMLLPTITYGFAIIYSFGKQGLLTRLFGVQLFDIYGFYGLLFGYVIYTLPISFMLILNTMGFVDKKFMVVSRVMGDGAARTFWQTILRPLLGTLAASFVQCFFLCFTDYGIPASVGGEYEVVASVLYNEMLGSIPNFSRGAVVAVMMLIPSVISIALLKYLERYNIRYSKISEIELKTNPVRDTVCGALSALIIVCVLAIFAVIFVVPFVQEWPYQVTFTLDHVRDVLNDSSLFGVYKNSIFVAVLTAVIGLIVTYGAALATARSQLNGKLKSVIDAIALVTNTIPGMVIGIAFMFIFSGTSLQNTFLLIILCNVVHFFSTPYLMMKNSLSKLNSSWETTASLMGDTWIKTIVRIVTPNMASTILEVFSYYFVNAMVTVSAVIFIAGARTMVITTKIKELQYYNKFNEVFVLSLFILATNLVVKGLLGYAIKIKEGKNSVKRRNKKMKTRKAAAVIMSAVVLGTFGLNACQGAEAGSASDQVVIYSNADDEAVEAMKKTLDENGYEGKYLFQTFGTSELGGKVIAEGTNIEADLITLSTFYIDSAQEQQNMFQPLNFDYTLIDSASQKDYCAPITSQEGTIIVNTQVLAENNLDMPTCLKDLTKEEYKDLISVTDIKSSSTAWLLIQALVSEYGEDGAKEVLTGIYENAGPHIESSGSGPLKKVRAGEVAIGFGLRQQAVADKADGLPIDFVDPTEGNFSLTESVAVIDKGDNTNPLAQEMAECIITKGRSELQKYYPNALYEGETTDAANSSTYPKIFPEPLTLELLEKHQELSESCK